MPSANVPGLIYPTQKAPLAGNPRDSAIAEMNNTNQKQNNINQIAGLRKKRKGGSIVVPQFGSSYTEQAGPGTGTNAQIAGLSKVSTQNAVDSSGDSYATKKGGKKTRRGGNTKWHWGCYSGGKKTRRGGLRWGCYSGGKKTRTKKNMKYRKRK
jgi:hypothetical protein